MNVVLAPYGYGGIFESEGSTILSAGRNGLKVRIAVSGWRNLKVEDNEESVAIGLRKAVLRLIDIVMSLPA